MRRLILIFLFASGAISTAARSYQDISAATLYSWISESRDIYLLDVREINEYTSSHIPGAVLYPWSSGVLKKRYGNLPAGRTIVVICAAGGRAADAAAFLETVGGDVFLGNLYRLDGGMGSWRYQVIRNDTALFTRLGVLAELFTAATSAASYEANRYLDEVLLPETAADSNFVIIRYHEGTPGLPFPEDRASYYGIETSPALVFNGTENVDPSSLSAGRVRTAAADSTTLFLELRADSSASDGPVKITATVTASALVGSDDLAFFLVAAESGIDPRTWTPPFYPANGETVFNQAVRSMVNSPGGKRFTIQPGEVVVFQNQLVADSSWKKNNCEIVAFVQQVVSREILQAERRTFQELGLAEPGPVLAVTCDFNGDGKVTVSDVIALLLFQRANPGDLRGDFNRDGKVGVTDAIAMLLAQRDNTCP